MQNWDVNRLLHLISHFMHGIRTNRNKFCSTAFQTLGCMHHDLRGVLPITLTLISFNLFKIYRIHQAFGGMQPTQLFFYSFVDQTVIFNRRFPTHAT
jgi:hypothetical protein